MPKEAIAGQAVVAKNIAIFGGKFLATVNKDLRNVAQRMESKIRENISLSDHSLSDLADLGHPYARSRSVTLHNPNYQVHTQSGEMVRGLYSGIEEANVNVGLLTGYAYAGIRDHVEHALFVIYGTTKMIPRDFLRGSVVEIKDEVIDILRGSLRHAVISFAGEKTRL